MATLPATPPHPEYEISDSPNLHPTVWEVPMDDPTELPQVIVGTCGCLLPTDSKPVGYVFKATAVGDQRVAVYA
jgi:hypothetical protein